MYTPTRADRAHLPTMSDEKRGEQIKQRRLALGIDGYREFAEATGRDRDTLSRAEQGLASKTTLDWLEAWLSRQETENGMTDPAPAEPLKIEMHGVYGVSEIIVTGPVDRPDELAEAVGKLLDRLKQRDES